MKDSSSFWLILTISLVSMVGPFSIDTYLPSFPDIESEFTISRTELLFSISAYLTAQALSTLFWGPLSDRTGRRLVILGSGFVYLLASVGCAMSADYSFFIFFRVVQGLAASGGMVASRAMLRDSFDQKGAHRAMSYAMMLFALAPAIAPIIGGWLHEFFGWRSVFYFLAIYAFFLMLMSYRFLPETLPVEDRQSFHPVYVSRQYFSMLLNFKFVALVLSLSISFAGLFIYVAGSATIIFDILGLDNKHFAVLFVPVTSGIIIGSFISSRLSHLWTTQQIIKLALSLLFFAGFINLIQALFLEANTFNVITPLVFYGIGTAVGIPGFTVLALDCFSKNRGAASAIQAFSQTMIAALTTSLVVPVLSTNIFNFAIAQLLCAGLAIIAWKIYLHHSVD